jgi:probable F420-dependent oxidoreductase
LPAGAAPERLTAVRFSFVIFGVPSHHSTALVTRAEELGFDTVWFGDHIVTPHRIQTRYPYTESGSAGYTHATPLNDVWVAIAHAAAATRTIRLGTSVLILPLRHPFAVAQSAVTAQNMSGGRVALGVGAGWLREEFDALGVDFASRGRRMDEALDVIRHLCADAPTGHSGEFYSFPPVSLGMTPVAPVPITVGGVSRAALRRAARMDGWMGAEVSLEEAIRYRAEIAALRESAGLDPDAFRCYVKPGDIEPDLLRRYAEAGFDDVVVPFRALYRDGPPLTLPQQLDALAEMAEAVMLPDLSPAAGPS